MTTFYVLVRRNISMRVALYVTCLIDVLRPSVGFAALRLLESHGLTVLVPPGQTCCGKPAASAGDERAAAALARKAIDELAGFDYVVIPSGSCADQICNGYPRLLGNDPVWGPRAQALAARTYELSRFLSEILPPLALPGDFCGTVSYHDSCKGLRQLGIKQQPRELLARLAGVKLHEMSDCEECCGFGGAFSEQFGEISTRIVDRKCDAIAASGCDAVVGGDLGCLLNIEGRLRRRGDTQTRVLHLAEILAGEEKP